MSVASCSSRSTDEAESPTIPLEAQLNVKRQAKKLLITNRPPLRKRKPRDSKSPIVVLSTLSGNSQEDCVELQKPTGESEVWEIEKEFIPQDKVEDEDKSGTHISRSIVLDARRWQRGGDVDSYEPAILNDVDMCADQNNKNSENAAAISPYFSDVIGSFAANPGTEASVTSLAPSQSASQRGYHSKPRQTFVKSNYFDYNQVSQAPQHADDDDTDLKNIGEKERNPLKVPKQAKYPGNVQSAASLSASHDLEYLMVEGHESPSMFNRCTDSVYAYQYPELENDIAPQYPLSDIPMPDGIPFQDYNDSELFGNGEDEQRFRHDNVQTDWCNFRDFDLEEEFSDVHHYEGHQMFQSLHASRNSKYDVDQEDYTVDDGNYAYEADCPLIPQAYTHEADTFTQDAPMFDYAYSASYFPDALSVAEDDRISCLSDSFDQARRFDSLTKSPAAADEDSLVGNDASTNTANIGLQFTEGKALLLGFQDDMTVNVGSRTRNHLTQALDPIESTERAVAQGMHSHWFPQKF